MAGGVLFEIPPLSDFTSLDKPLDDSSLIKSSSRTEAVIPSSIGNGETIVTQSLQASYQTTQDCSTSKSVAVSGDPSIAFSCPDSQYQNSEASLFQVPEYDHVAWNKSSFTAFEPHSSSIGSDKDGEGSVTVGTPREGACKEAHLFFSGNQAHPPGNVNVTFPHKLLPSKEVEDEFGYFSNNKVTKCDELFGDFSSAEDNKPGDLEGREDGDFGDFSSFGYLVATKTVAAASISAAALTTTVNESRTPTDASGEDFGEFSTCSKPVTTLDGKLPDRIVTTLSTAAGKSGNDEFGEFSGFLDISATISNSTIHVPENDFGEFGVFPDVIAPVTAAAADDFGAFMDNPATITNTGVAEDDFGEFGFFSSSATVAAATTAVAEDYFREFSGETITKGDDDFGEFGDFSSTSTAAVGFSSAAPSWTTAQPSSNYSAEVSLIV